MMLRRVGLCFLILLLGFDARAIEAVTSFTIFYKEGADHKRIPYAEVYWQINPGTIHYTKNDAGLWYSKVKTSVLFRAEDGEVIAEDMYMLETTPQDSLGILTQNIIELQRYNLQPGKVYIDVLLADPFMESNQYAYHDSVEIIIPKDEAYLSDIQLIDTAYVSTVPSIFLKNGQQQIPLCINFFDDNRKTLRYYGEIYKADVLKNMGVLRTKVFISKTERGQTVYGLQNVDTLKSIVSKIPYSGNLDIRVLPSGNYYLNTILENEQGKMLSSEVLFFQRSNLSPLKKEVAETVTADTGMQKVEIFDLSSTFVGKYKLPQLRAILKMLQPIANPTEANAIAGFMKKPEETYMRYFIYNFFSSRNEQNPKKEWDAFTTKVKEVNKLFGSAGIPGYETERGVVWLKYGKPNERIQVQNEQGALPYEIWQYNATERQSSPGTFLFYSPGFMINDYRLLHSTVNGETRNSNWRSILYTNSGSGSGNLNSRAEQYIGNR